MTDPIKPVTPVDPDPAWKPAPFSHKKPDRTDPAWTKAIEEAEREGKPTPGKGPAR